MKKHPLKIQVSSNGVATGILSVEEFKTYMTKFCGSGKFLNSYVSEFNKMKESCGEPERVSIKLVK